jgi:uncharacterized tellurite resistance protein B-like protein
MSDFMSNLMASMHKSILRTRLTSRHLCGVFSHSKPGLADMPIIALLFSTLAFWGFYWFIRMGGFDHVQSILARRKEEVRRLASRERERTASLRTIDDPRDAAIILMLLMARVGGDPVREQITAIEQKARTSFGFDADLIERITQARFIAGRAHGFEQAAGLFSDLFNKCLTRNEKLELISMLEEVASIDRPSESQEEALQALKRRIGLAPQR